MSWQLAALLVVVGALGAGFWWYERSRPPAKLIAVVATLAALAALGRDAFAALPDVKPITAIVLLSGYTFGAGPGFAVGAIGALASNIELGQGPWTPWQMLAWGLVGVGGALLARASGRRLGRVGLALCCGGAAAFFESVLDLYTWTGTGAHTLAAYGLVVGQALPFSVTHVVASFVFGFAFGPALVRMLLRVRARLEVAWLPSSAVPLGLAVAFAGAGLFAALGPAPAARASAAPSSAGLGPEIAYLRSAQNADGGFGGAPGMASSELYTAWAAIGLAAADVDPATVSRDGHSIVYALRAGAATLSGAGDLERTILALHACDASVTSLAGRNPLAELERMRSPDGALSGEVILTAFGIFAFRAAGLPASSPLVTSAGRWLAAQENSDGGFSFARRGSPSDSEDTAAALQGIVDSLGRSNPIVARATDYLLREQDSDGGWAIVPGSPSDAQSTSWVAQGLAAAGRNPGGVRRRGASRTPVAYLRSLVAPGGSVRYSPSSTQSPVWVTAQALTGLAAAPFPIAPPPPAR